MFRAVVKLVPNTAATSLRFDFQRLQHNQPAVLPLSRGSFEGTRVRRGYL